MFYPFFDWVVVFFFFRKSFISYLPIWEINPLLDASSENIFSHSDGCLFILFMVSLAMQKLLLLSCFSHVRLCVTSQTAAHQAPLSLGFSRQEYWSGLPLPSPHWTWVWVNSGSWWWTGRPGVLRFMGSQNRTWLSNWTEAYIWFLAFDIYCCASLVRLGDLSEF